ncbi:sulfurtransferase [Melioribacter sp. OK-6-Me]|uniref:sulfurtransferase n=1 Tax=unclassified Melioribacter TaxID=2627329 RepID=UPI003ED8493E
MANKYLIEIEELYDKLHEDNLIIVDTREPEDYLIDHIPGAVNIYDIFSYLATESNGGYEQLRKHFANLFGLAGIDSSKEVVVYEDAMDNGYGRSCRGWFIFNHMGHKNVRILHGGYQAWLDKNLNVERHTPHPELRKFEISVDNSIILNKKQMLAAIQNPEITIIDCRDRAEWVGVSSSPYGPDFTPRKGRIPGSVWIEWYNTMEYKGFIPWFKSPEQLNEMFKKFGLSEDKVLYLYCFKGARTSNLFVALKMAGYEKVYNYLASWNEWSRDLTLPIEQGYPKRMH